LVRSGGICEANFECGLSNELNNCGTWDIYRTVAPGQLWLVVAGEEHCEVTNDGKCVTDGLHQNHGNNEDCIFQAVTSIFATATQFDTEVGYDYIAVGSTRYDGSSGPVSLPMNAGERMIWHTDQAIYNAGFTICGSLAPPALSLSGLCSNQAGCNGRYEAMGVTASGAKWYKHLLTGCTIYLDPACHTAGVSALINARWILDAHAPSTTAISDLDGDGRCSYAAAIDHAAIGVADDSRLEPPIGTHNWQVFCGSDWTEVAVTMEKLALSPSPPPLPFAPPPAPAIPPVAPHFDGFIGQGYCRDASGNNPWSTVSACSITEHDCRIECMKQYNCACFAYTPTPATNHDGCQDQQLGRCNVYLGNTTATQTETYDNNSAVVLYRAYAVRPRHPASSLSPPPPHTPIEVSEGCDDEPTTQNGGIDSCPTGGGCGEKTTLSLKLNSGWNWVSLNLAPEDYSVQHVFNKTAMNLTDKDALKSAGSFTLFYDVTGFNQWYGELFCMTNTEMFKLKLQDKGPQTARIRGKPVKLPMKLTLTAGWNWMPYPYQEPSSLLDSGGNFDHSVLTNGDIFKRNNQQFTRWYDVTGYKGWIGSPKAQHLEPGEGHKLLLASGGNFTFFSPQGRRQLANPMSSASGIDVHIESLWASACRGGGSNDSDPSTWSVAEGHFQTSNLMTIGVKIDGKIMNGGWLAAFVGDEIRGVQKDQGNVPRVDIAGEWAGTKVFSLAVQGNIEDGDSNKMIKFHYSVDGTYSVKLDTTIMWEADAVVGSAFNPFVVMTKCAESLRTQVV